MREEAAAAAQAWAQHHATNPRQIDWLWVLPDTDQHRQNCSRNLRMQERLTSGQGKVAELRGCLLSYKMAQLLYCTVWQEDLVFEHSGAPMEASDRPRWRVRDLCWPVTDLDGLRNTGGHALGRQPSSVCMAFPTSAWSSWGPRSSTIQGCARQWGPTTGR